MKRTSHRDFTVRSFASDILSIYAFGVTAVLRANGQLSKSQAKRLACQLFESDFGWTKAEAEIRVNALEFAAGDEGSLFAPVIDAGGKAFLSWRSTWHIPQSSLSPKPAAIWKMPARLHSRSQRALRFRRKSAAVLFPRSEFRPARLMPLPGVAALVSSAGGASTSKSNDDSEGHRRMGVFARRPRVPRA
jgi:hypothetical protein